LHFKTFPVIGQKWRLGLSPLKILVGSWRMSKDCTFLLPPFWSYPLKSLLKPPLNLQGCKH
jgi:hypothetical protein